MPAINEAIHHDPGRPTVLWDVLPECNFRCTYCYSELLWNRATHETPRPPLEHMVAAFDEFLPGWVVNFSGGEPFLWRDLPDMAHLLTRTRDVGIYTNLTVSSSVRRFADVVDPARVLFIDCGVHVTERIRVDPDLGKFFALYSHLVDAGFQARATYIVHPDNEHRVAEDVRRLTASGVRLNIRVFRGVHAGRSYPESFSSELLDFLTPHECLPQRGEAVRAQMTGLGGLCRAGMVFLELAANGEAFRCGTDRSMGRDCLGNLFAATLRVHVTAMPCRSQVCLSCRQGMGLSVNGFRALGPVNGVRIAGIEHIGGAAAGSSE